MKCYLNLSAIQKMTNGLQSPERKGSPLASQGDAAIITLNMERASMGTVVAMGTMRMKLMSAVMEPSAPTRTLRAGLSTRRCRTASTCVQVSSAHTIFANSEAID